MKVFFGLLLIVNIAFAAFQWLLPYEQLFVEQKKVPLAEQLQLLADPTERIVSETEVVAAVETEEPGVEALVVEDSSDKRLCYTIGPFKEKTRALEVSGRYSANDVKTELKSSLEKEYLGVMVYIDGHKSRDEAKKTADALAAKGIRDYIIISDEDRINVLSLGVFGLKKNADRHRDRIAKLDARVKTEARYRDRTIYWLYNQQSSESSQKILLDASDLERGISQIPSQCA
tara:strand:+ start:178 stop:870 length:693 start_codon:yes stop_codon:yes gene_type:complete